nr:GGDEF domain-containing protein [Roseateles koreensis]
MRNISDRVVDGIRLQLRNAELAEKLRNSLHVKEQEAATDALTLLMNRRAFDDLLDGYARDQRGFAVLMLDIDHFKAVNDHHGHAVGDALLRGFAACIRGQLRGSDVCARYGGEEFVVVLPGASNVRALEVAERLCQTVAAAPLIDEPALHITVSIGVGIRHPSECVRRLMARADAAVYAAKHGGRNQVCVAE